MGEEVLMAHVRGRQQKSRPEGRLIGGPIAECDLYAPAQVRDCYQTHAQ
jgi:hypothetical protein